MDFFLVCLQPHLEHNEPFEAKHLPLVQESTSGVIMLSEDPPLAVQAMLRYLSGNSLSEIYRPAEPIFSDVERDLDVFAIADKYDLQKLRTYMNSRLVHFYSTDQRPPWDPKGWSAKNQDGFASVLRKLSELEMDCREIQLAIAGFLIRRSNMIMKWEGVREAIEDNPQFLKDLFLASLQRTKELEATVQNLEERLEDLEEYSSCLEEERDDLIAREEYMAAFFDGASRAYHGPFPPEYGDWTEYYHGNCYDYGGHEGELEMEGIPSPPTPSTPLFVEDILSGISFVLTPDGPEPVNME
jgi:hypothetical protein